MTLKAVKLFLFVSLASCIVTSNLNADSPTSITAKSVIEYQYRVIKSYPHGSDVFTQGLEFHQGLLYESAGQRGRSRLFTRSLNNIEPKQQHRLADKYFAEGITVLNEHIYQLTWQAERGFIYQQRNLKPAGSFTINGEGWGLTNNGKHLIVSNGTSQLSFIDADDFSLSHKIQVTFNSKPLNNINELEWINGLIYANIWQSNWIVMIDPNNGQVVGKVFLKNLLTASLKTAKTDVLNGIAYDHEKQRLFVTGKNWPRLFHIELLLNNQAVSPSHAAP